MVRLPGHRKEKNDPATLSILGPKRLVYAYRPPGKQSYARQTSRVAQAA